jgi:hypothetical protein
MNQLRAAACFLVLFGISQVIIAQDTKSLVQRAYEAYKLGHYDESATLIELAINSGTKGPIVLYDASRYFTLAGKKEKAWLYLEQAVDQGFNHFKYIQNDTALVNLHSDPRWHKLIEKIKPKELEVNSRTNLRDLNNKPKEPGANSQTSPRELDNKPKETGTNLQTNFHELVNNMHNIAANAYQYKIRSKHIGGGGGSYTGYKLPDNLSTKPFGTCRVNVLNDNGADIVAASNYGYGTIKAKLNSEGSIDNLEYTGEFKKLGY